jgi:GR25 family glycosyltransferase involved in LPS biosynthesis
MFIFEHDALFTSRVEFEILDNVKHDVISINSPIGATRKASLFNEKVVNAFGRVVDVPKIDEDNIPQGLPGNSAYYIKPAGAKKLINLVAEYGAWPNDAIMCRQLMPGKLGCLKPFCTIVQKSQSFTSL